LQHRTVTRSAKHWRQTSPLRSATRWPRMARTATAG